MENLNNMPADPQPDLASLPRAAFREIMRVLSRSLPSAASDTPAVQRQRDLAALAGVAALLPVNAAEGRLAAQFVAADAWAAECMNQARERQAEPEIVRKCLAQAISLTREGKSSLRLLAKLQAARQKMDTDEAGERAAWVEHAAASLMQQALDPVPDAAAGGVATEEAAAPDGELVSGVATECSAAEFETPERLAAIQPATVPVPPENAG
jgi:hypothetical protein